MSPSDIARMSDQAIVEMIVALPDGREAEVLAGDEIYYAITELRRRHVVSSDIPRTAKGRIRTATSVELDPERWRAAWYRRRLTLTAVSELAGKCGAWAHVIARKGCCSYFVLDAIAAELGETTDDLVYEVASDRERQRISFA